MYAGISSACYALCKGREKAHLRLAHMPAPLPSMQQTHNEHQDDGGRKVPPSCDDLQVSSSNLQQLIVCTLAVLGIQSVAAPAVR